MSYVFDIDDETVWSPSLRVGDLYVRMLQDVGSVLGVPTGLSAISSDMWDIDIDAFENLVKTMYETYFSTGNSVLKVLIEGVLAPSIVLLERGGKEIHSRTGQEREFRDRALKLSMAR
ncbi:DUF6086 domain-containing protein [Nocardia ninae]|uniref:Uncharacterized protein n=1 Tax=Nocardia ninae NBRC 108245 TaxID=1210091 RepID=A0A511M9R7_9NOCA|nr:DUF6086 family protein [Nocardia ninae]GEM37261.1 hypothetical protein NN4_17800 [Nocardia ninae NBRC 108245]